MIHDEKHITLGPAPTKLKSDTKDLLERTYLKVTLNSDDKSTGNTRGLNGDRLHNVLNLGEGQVDEVVDNVLSTSNVGILEGEHRGVLLSMGRKNMIENLYIRYMVHIPKKIRAIFT